MKIAKSCKNLTALLVLACLLAACGGESGGGTVTTATPSADTTTAAPETTIFPENLPEKDYGGHQFRLLSSDEIGSIRYSYEIDAESENGEPLNDAVYRRNTAVEELLNIEIVKVEVPKAQIKGNFTASVMSGDDDYDVMVDEWGKTLAIAHEYCLEIGDLPHVNIDNEWWDTDIIEGAAIGGKSFGLTGDINIVDNKATWCLLFNKRLADEYVKKDLYALVRDGKWTLDALESACKNVQSDLNGDSVYDDKDQWGLVGTGNVAMSFLWSGGGRFGTLEKDGSVTLTMDSNRNMDVLNRAYELFAKKDLVLDVDKITDFNGLKTATERSRQMFTDGQILFLGSVVSYCEYFREMNDEFGFLPNPKYDEAQKDYICTAQEWCATMFSVPRSAPDAERTSIILEAMGSASLAYITPAFYDVSLERKLTRDDESSEMLDIIFDSRVFDIVYAYNFGGIQNFKKVMVADSNTVASQMASYKTSVEAAYTTTYETITAAQ